MIRLIIFFCLLILSCCTTRSTEIRENHIIQLVDYLKESKLDSSVFNEPFFNNAFRSKENPYNMYYIGLEELQKQLKKADGYKVNEANDIGGDNVFRLSITSGKETKPVYFLVTDDGIESFSPMMKGEKIVGWF
jgi:hypothetical protein